MPGSNSLLHCSHPHPLSSARCRSCLPRRLLPASSPAASLRCPAVAQRRCPLPPAAHQSCRHCSTHSTDSPQTSRPCCPHSPGAAPTAIPPVCPAHRGPHHPDPHPHTPRLRQSRRRCSAGQGRRDPAGRGPKSRNSRHRRCQRPGSSRSACPPAVPPQSRSPLLSPPPTGSPASSCRGGLPSADHRPQGSPAPVQSRHSADCRAYPPGRPN